MIKLVLIVYSFYLELGFLQKDTWTDDRELHYCKSYLVDKVIQT